MASTTITIKVNADQLLTAFSELNLYVDRLFSNSRSKLVNFLFCGNEIAPGLIESETLPTPDLWTQTAFLKPSNLFFDLLAALRTGGLDDFLVQADFHKTSDKNNNLTSNKGTRLYGKR